MVVARSARGSVGPSVGDGRAWLLEDDELKDLTEGQVRKPLLEATKRLFALSRPRADQGQHIFLDLVPKRSVSAGTARP